MTNRVLTFTLGTQRKTYTIVHRYPVEVTIENAVAGPADEILAGATYTYEGVCSDETFTLSTAADGTATTEEFLPRTDCTVAVTSDNGEATIAIEGVSGAREIVTPTTITITYTFALPPPPAPLTVQNEIGTGGPADADADYTYTVTCGDYSDTLSMKAGGHGHDGDVPAGS